MHIIDRKFLNVTTPSCHASSIAFYKNKPVYTWFGGTQEGMPDSSIYIQADNTTHVIGNKDPIPRWNPILFPYEDKLYLFVKLGRFCDCWSTIFYDISNIFEYDFDIDNAKFQILNAGLNGPVKTKVIIHENRIYCGSSVENILDWTSFIEQYTMKDGKLEFLSRSNPLIVPKKIYDDPYYGKRQTMGIIQPSLWKSGNTKYTPLHAFFRSSRGLGKIYYSSSFIDGLGDLSWSKPIATKLDNPNSGIDTIYMNNRLFLIHNPSETYRYPLVISELDKEFKVMNELVIQEKTNGNTNSPELSYPYAIENNGKIYLSYTYGRSKIEVVTLEI